MKLKAIYSKSRPQILYFLRGTLIFVSYFIAAKVGLSLEPVGGFATVVWPPTGIAIASLLILGYRYWPIIAFGAFLVNLTVGASIPVAVGIAIGNTLEAITVVYILKRYGRDRVRSFVDLLVFIFIAVPLGAIVSAGIGTTSLLWGNVINLSVYGGTWKAWVLGDILGAIIFTPLIMGWKRWFKHSPKQLKELDTPKIIEGAIAISLVGIFSLMAFDDLWVSIFHFPQPPSIYIPYIIFLLLFLISLKTSQRIASLAILTLMTITITATAEGFFNSALLPAGIPLGQALFQLQIFVGVLAITTIIVSSMMDERRGKEERSRALNFELQEAQALAHIGSWEWNLTTNIMKWSDELYRIRGYKPQEFQPRIEDWFKQVYETDRKRVTKEMYRAVKQQLPFNTHYRIVRPNGSVREIHARASLHTDTVAKEVKILGVAQDITAIKQGRRDLELRTQELQKALVEIKKTNEQKDRFLAIVGHELRNPLAPIISSLELIQKEIDKSKNKKFKFAIQTIKHQSLNIKRLMDDLLDISRISYGKIRLRKELVDIRSIVTAAQESSRRLIESRQHNVTVSIPKEPLTANVDPVRLEQILNNLLTNAAKYTEPGGNIHLAIKKDKKNLTFSIRDDGIGIPPEMLEKIFKMFEQSTGQLHKTQGGLGIGLRLVKSLVELHGGSILAKSLGIGHGSEFIVTLPRHMDAVKITKPQKPNLIKKGLSNNKKSRQKILIVDDNRDAADSLSALLNSIGYRSSVMYSGKEALDVLLDEKPDILLLDVEMPNMNGYEVVEKIRNELKMINLPIVAITGYGQDHDKQRALDVGFDYYFVKPVKVSEITNLLDRLSNTKKQSVAVA